MESNLSEEKQEKILDSENLGVNIENNLVNLYKPSEIFACNEIDFSYIGEVAAKIENIFYKTFLNDEITKLQLSHLDKKLSCADINAVVSNLEFIIEDLKHVFLLQKQKKQSISVSEQSDFDYLNLLMKYFNNSSLKINNLIEDNKKLLTFIESYNLLFKDYCRLNIFNCDDYCISKHLIPNELQVSLRYLLQYEEQELPLKFNRQFFKAFLLKSYFINSSPAKHLSQETLQNQLFSIEYAIYSLCYSPDFIKDKVNTSIFECLLFSDKDKQHYYNITNDIIVSHSKLGTIGVFKYIFSSIDKSNFFDNLIEIFKGKTLNKEEVIFSTRTFLYSIKKILKKLRYDNFGMFIADYKSNTLEKIIFEMIDIIISMISSHDAQFKNKVSFEIMTFLNNEFLLFHEKDFLSAIYRHKIFSLNQFLDKSGFIDHEKNGYLKRMKLDYDEFTDNIIEQLPKIEYFEQPKLSVIELDIQNILKILNKKVYGLDYIKSILLKNLSIAKYNNNGFKISPTLLYGSPGVGKSYLLKIIAEELGIPYLYISLNGMNSWVLSGQHGTWRGASQGLISKFIEKHKGLKNGIIILDEVDKVNNVEQDNFPAALSSILDENLNNEYTDLFNNKKYDLSGITFFMTANELQINGKGFSSNILPEYLLNRINLINVRDYTNEEKKIIIKEHVINKVKEKYTYLNNNFILNDDILEHIIKNCTEKGLRQAEKYIDMIYKEFIFQSDIDKNYIISKNTVIDLINEYKKDNKFNVGFN